MLFNTKVFVAFLLIVLAVYYRLGDDAKRWWLLVASFVFYGFVDPRLCLLVGAAILVGWGSALGIASGRGRGAWLAFGLGGTLGALAFFKYYDFAVRSVEFWAGVLGRPVDAGWMHLDVLLPVGISFYTFQIVSYVVDVYRGKFAAERSLRDFALYVMFFPQLVAGPVERATHLLPQYKLPFRLTRAQVAEGVFLILLGYVKKVVIGDRIADWIDPHFAEEVSSPAIAWMSVLLFTTDIYVDFSAYSDIAIGIGRLLGYDIRPNFDLPFVVPSIPERWRRWHISMGHWFRDYVYFPLGGNRRGEWRSHLNLMIVMFLSGLWHGASYNFVVWGVLNGLAMVGHRLLQPVLNPIAAAMDRGPVLRWGYFYLCCFNTMLMISSINIFFRSDTWPVAKSYVRAMFWDGLLDPTRVFWLEKGVKFPASYGIGFAFMGLVIVAHELERHLDAKAEILRRPWLLVGMCVAMFVTIVLFGVKGEQFIYYQF